MVHVITHFLLPMRETALGNPGKRVVNTTQVLRGQLRMGRGRGGLWLNCPGSCPHHPNPSSGLSIGGSGGLTSLLCPFIENSSLMFSFILGSGEIFIPFPVLGTSPLLPKG